MNDADVIAMLREVLAEVAPNRRAAFEGLNLSWRIDQLGIDSLRTLEMIGELEDRLQVSFDETAIRELATLEDVAALMRGAA